MRKEDFVSRMLKYNNPYVPYYYPIKRSFGQTIESCSLEAVIAYTNLSDTKNRVMQNKEFIVAGLCYNISNQTSTTFVKFEELLRRMVKADLNGTRKKEVENFLKLHYDDNGYFTKRFYSIAKKVISYLNSTETIDFISLLWDLDKWDDGNAVKMRWAMTIVNLKEDIKNDPINKEDV